MKTVNTGSVLISACLTGDVVLILEEILRHIVLKVSKSSKHTVTMGAFHSTKNSSLSLAETFLCRMEQHFPKFAEKKTTSRGISKFSKIQQFTDSIPSYPFSKLLRLGVFNCMKSARCKIELQGTQKVEITYSLDEMNRHCIV